jgi:hypothetical protein
VWNESLQEFSDDNCVKLLNVDVSKFDFKKRSFLYLNIRVHKEIWMSSDRVPHNQTDFIY